MNNKRQIILLIGASFITYLGAGITQMYSMIWVYRTTGSNFYTSLQSCAIFGAGIIGAILFSQQRFQKYPLNTMMMAEIISGLAIFLTGYFLSLPSIYLGLIIIYIMSGFYKPCYQTVLGQMINTADSLKKINGISSTLHTLSLATGWFLGPFLFQHLDFKGLFYLDSISFLLSFYLISKIHIKQKPITSTIHTNVCSHMLAKQPFMSILTVFIAASLIFASIDAMEVGIFISQYKLNDTKIGYFFILWIMLGSLSGMLEQIKQLNFNPHTACHLFALLMIIIAVLFCIKQSFITGLMLYGLCGFFYTYIEILSNRLIYQKIHNSNYADAFNIKNFIFNLTMLTSMPLIGLAADTFPFLNVMLVCGIVAFFIMNLQLVFRRYHGLYT